MGYVVVAGTQPRLPCRSPLAELDKPVSLHTLRHSFATHLLEQNVDIRVIPALYTRVATNTIRAVMSPLDQIIGKSKKAEPPA